ncbi:MAG: reverse transcriptase-like protein, partial [Cyanobacteria bacterium J06639_18]
TEEGNYLYINIEDQYKKIDDLVQAVPNEFRGYSFNSEVVQVRPLIEKTGQKAIAYVDNKPIGTISPEDFKKIEPTGASLIPIKAKIESNITTLKVTLDSETIQYPKAWVKEREEVSGKEAVAINTSEESFKVDEISSKLYQEITTREPITFEDTLDIYTNTINLVVDERKLEAIEKWLHKNNAEFQVSSTDERKIEATKGMRVIEIDKDSLTLELLEKIVNRTGGVKSDRLKLPQIPIIPEESVYYSDPKANYGDNQYPAIGLAIPSPDTRLVNQFVEKYNLEVSGFTEDNVTYFSIIDVEGLSYEEYAEIYTLQLEEYSPEKFECYKQNLIKFKQDLAEHLGSHIDLGEQSNFDIFTQKVDKIKDKLDRGSSTLEKIQNLGSEYNQTLQKLPNRPEIEGYVEPPAPDVSIVKKRKDARVILRIGSAYNKLTQESGASAILVSNDGKKQLAEAANYYPNEKGDLKAAYKTLIQGLNEARERGYKFVRVETSNNNLYQRLQGNPNFMHFTGKNKECEPLHQKVMELAKSFEWGINSKFTSYKSFPTANQANQVAYNAISQKSSTIGDFGQSQIQNSSSPVQHKQQTTFPNLSELSTVEIVREGNTTQARAALPKIPDNPQISGKPIPMTWKLNQPPELKGVDTTIDAMRGHGRVHSTRAQNYYQTYGIKEGDIAICFQQRSDAAKPNAIAKSIAQSTDNKQVAFRVGKQYKITQAMIDDPEYQKAWVNWEKHSVKELTENQAAKGKQRQLYGLFMEPLGDYQNGKIIPFDRSQQQNQQLRTLTINFDGASRNNGKPDAQAAAAVVLINPEGRKKEFSEYLGNKT